MFPQFFLGWFGLASLFVPCRASAGVVGIDRLVEKLGKNDDQIATNDRDVQTNTKAKANSMKKEEPSPWSHDPYCVYVGVYPFNCTPQIPHRKRHLRLTVPPQFRNSFNCNWQEILRLYFQYYRSNRHLNHNGPRPRQRGILLPR